MTRASRRTRPARRPRRRPGRATAECRGGPASGNGPCRALRALRRRREMRRPRIAPSAHRPRCRSRRYDAPGAVAVYRARSRTQFAMMGGMSDDCLFCRIVSGDVPADVVATNDAAVAFRDISPVAPTHVLVIPRVHEPNLAAVADAAPDALVAMVRLARDVAAADGVADAGYRLVANTGA